MRPWLPEKKRRSHPEGAAEVSWRTLVLQGAALLCVVVWLTSLVVAAVLQRTDGVDGRQAEEEHHTLLETGQGHTPSTGYGKPPPL